MPDVQDPERGESRATGGAGVADLPLWAGALPLWAGASWLWIVVRSDGTLGYWRGAGDSTPEPGQAPGWDALPQLPPGPLLVLDYRLRPDLPAACWLRLAARLAPGGVLFICGPRRPGLPSAIRAAAPILRPAAWHLITPRQDGAWYLRPAGVSFRRLLDRQLDPAYSARAWLTQTWRARRAPAARTACLPVWRRSPLG